VILLENRKTSQEKNSENPSRKIPDRVILAFFIMAALGFILGGYLFYKERSVKVHAEKTSDLNFITTLKVNQIIEWRRERLVDAHMDTEQLTADSSVMEWLSDPRSGVTETDILNQLGDMATLEGYQNVFIADPSGKVLLTLDPNLKTLEPETRKVLNEAAASVEVTFGDFFLQSNSQKVFLDVVSPILDDSNQPRAFLILRSDPQKYLYPLIQSWPTPSESAETLIVRRDGDTVLFLNPLRHVSYPALTFRLPLERTEVPAVQAIMGRTGPMEGIDYRGVDVLADLMPIPGTGWSMIAKVDRGEILAEINSLAAQTLVVVVLAIIITIILGAYVFNVRQRQLYQKLLTAEQERSASRMETRTILYGIGDGVIATDREGHVTHLNPVAEEMTGWKEEEALGRLLEEIFHLIDERTRSPLENPVRQVLREEKVNGLGEYSLLISRDGRETPVADSAAPFYSQQDEIIGVVLVFRDQTEERLVQKERALFNDTLSASLNEIYLFDHESLIYRTANTGALKNLGLTLEELQKMTPLDIKSEFTLNSFQNMLRLFFEEEEKIHVFETVHRRLDGSSYPAECHLQLINRDGEKLFLEVVLDITTRRQAQNDLLISEERHRLLAENAHDVIWTMDMEYRLTYVSPSVGTLLGFSPEELIGRSLEESLTSESAGTITEALKDNLLGQNFGLPFKNTRVELEQRRKDGSTVWTEVSISGMYNDEGLFIGIVGVTRDISESRQAQEELTFRLRFEELISRVSTGFINLPAGKIDEEIIQALGEIGSLMDVDRAFAYSFDRGHSEFCISHEWCRPGLVSPAAEISDIFFPAHPALSQALLRNEAVILEGSEEIAAFFDTGKDNPLPGLHSIAVFPIWLNQDLFGCVGFESASPDRRWGEDNLLHLQQFSNILSSCFERNRLVREIEKRAVRDELTGVYNRRGLMEIGQLELQRARRYHHPLGMIFFDVDYFKKINDTLGHTAGDLVLKEIARRAGEIIREVDVLCRWGGDEFLVLLPESDLEFTCQVGERLHDRMSREPFQIFDEEIPIGISVGVSGAVEPSITLDEMLRNADESLYAAKAAGRNNVACGKFS
jgi:diguanylate cyclase (GGDEF)-like protein/PAS domain S-box-containing protein